MTRQAVLARQTRASAVRGRYLRCTISSITATTVTVAIPGGTQITGIRVAGLPYTVGGNATVWIDEPAIGPVLPTAS